MLKKQSKNKQTSIWNVYTKLLASILGGAIIFWALAVVAYICWGVGFTIDATILTFVGILATFVVVSNYIQVKEIKDEFRNKMVEIEHSLESTRETAEKNINQVAEKSLKSMSKFCLDSSKQMISGAFPNFDAAVGFLALAVESVMESNDEAMIDELFSMVDDFIKRDIFKHAEEKKGEFETAYEELASSNDRARVQLEKIKKINATEPVYVMNGGNASGH